MEESELIDQYLRGELDEEQMETFSSRLQLDSELQSRVDLRKLVIEGISQSYSQELKTKLADFDRSLETKKRFQFSWKMAAILIVIMAVMSILFIINKKPDPHSFDLAEAGLPNTMGSSNTIALNNAMSKLKAGDYVSSGLDLNQLLIENPLNDTLLYYSGVCDFRLRKTKGAAQKWNLIKVKSIFYEKAQYRMAIAYWADDDPNSATKILHRLSQSKDISIREHALQALQGLE